MKACNICKKFKGFGLHWLAGTCFKHEEIPMFSYKEFAESCDDYDSDFVSCCDNCIFTGKVDYQDIPIFYNIFFELLFCFKRFSDNCIKYSCDF